MRMRTVGLGTHSGGSWLAMSRVEDAWNDLSDFTSNLERRRSPCFAQNRKRNGTPPRTVCGLRLLCAHELQAPATRRATHWLAVWKYVWYLSPPAYEAEPRLGLSLH